MSDEHCPHPACWHRAGLHSAPPDADENPGPFAPDYRPGRCHETVSGQPCPCPGWHPDLDGTPAGLTARQVGALRSGARHRAARAAADDAAALAAGQQPRLPGDAGAVRDVEIPHPAFELPRAQPEDFHLTHPTGAPVPQLDLFSQED